ncbi:phage integrase family protein [[Actinomadura] parvosata subsp. kistnae]|uniref:Site-specific integrase n=1 Tax=[Actinomadura] parvosata subsp. kistnae TaxID=1909395 RepID=A0A1V0AED7_9ACTN|nr:tyrosine-type recombinase/integrase [Nonomuraea sp. ATCC 55076]AQZ68594.1 site-specific integrase [Nonomuraea sp. ATCC 55076]SPL92935.1 phage integrase family protein [Actinomadura parvosata subsp. kistnae]
MNTTYDVKFSQVQQRSNRGMPVYVARWRVAGKEKSKSFRTKGLANAFMSDLRQAAKAGEEFDVATGLPVSMLAPEATGPSFLEFAQAYVLRRWNMSAARTRETDAYALLSLIPALVADAPRRPPADDLREVLRIHALLPEQRRTDLTPTQASVLSWLERASLPLTALGEAHVLRAALAAISVTFAGEPAGANTVRRKRAVLHHLLEHAVEQKVFSSNPLDEIKWTVPKAVTAVDPRTVVNPAQAKQLLDAIPKVGRKRGPRLKALFACIYYAALRPEEAADLRQRNCTLPESGWGLIVLEKARPQGTKRWTNSGETHESRSLKHRADKETREIPIPPVLVAILREHIATFGTAEDGRIFTTRTGGTYSSSAHSYVWQEARKLALTPAQVASSLAARPYDLRHAAVSLWLNAGVPAVEVAKRAGHSVDVLLRVYAKCMDGQQEQINSKINSALDE